MLLRMKIVSLLSEAAKCFTDIEDEENKNVMLDIAEKYLDAAQEEYINTLDTDVLNIIAEVQKELESDEDNA